MPEPQNNAAPAYTPPSGVTFDFSKSIPVNTEGTAGSAYTPPAGVTFDFSKSRPIDYNAIQQQQTQDQLNSLPHDRPDLRQPSTVADVAKGFGKEALKTITGIGDLAAKPAEALGLAQPLSPETIAAREKTMTQTNTAQKFGGLTENMAEFAGGEEALRGVATLAHLGAHAPEVLDLMEKYPKASKVVTSMMRGGVVGGAQGTAKGAVEGKAVKEGVAGAVGGAVGAGITETGIEAAKPILNALNIGKPAAEAMEQAARPAVTDFKWDKNLDTALPIIANMDKSKVHSVGEFAGMLQEEANNVRATQFNPAIIAHANEPIDLKPVYDKVTEAAQGIEPLTGAGQTPLPRPASQLDRYEPSQAKTIRDFADNFKGTTTVAQAEADLRFFNKQLAKYYRMDPSRASAEVEIDQNIAKYEAAADGMRDVLYNHLEQQGVSGVREMQQQYGALTNLSRVFGKRARVVDRQPNLDMTQRLSLIFSIPAVIDELSKGNIGSAAVAASAPVVATGVKMAGKPVPLIKTAIRNAKPDSGVVAAGKKIVERGTEAIGGSSGAAAGRMVTEDSETPTTQP